MTTIAARLKLLRRSGAHEPGWDDGPLESSSLVTMLAGSSRKPLEMTTNEAA